MGFFDKAKGKLGVVNKGASLGMQAQWRSLSAGQKNQLRRTLTDSDRDGVPNKFDCQPFNPKAQDDDEHVHTAAKKYMETDSQGYVVKRTVCGCGKRL